MVLMLLVVTWKQQSAWYWAVAVVVLRLLTILVFGGICSIDDTCVVVPKMCKWQ